MHYLSLPLRGLRAALCLLLALGSFSLFAATINVSTVAQLRNALQSANAGDEIVVAAGTYTATNEATSTSSAYFYSNRNGTASNPITIRGACGSTPTLQGNDFNRWTVLRIEGDNWIVRDLKIRNGEKGLIFDNSNGSQAIRCEVYDIGNEAIHVRDGSNNCIIAGCRVYNTGLKRPQFGEGIYVGTARSNWDRYNRDHNNTIIRDCTIGPNVRAECFDIKEGTRNTIIERCTIDARGIVLTGFEDSFIDLKGQRQVVRYNRMIQNGGNLARGVAMLQIRGAEDVSGDDAVIHNNEFIFDGSNTAVQANSGTTGTFAWANTQTPGNITYSSRVETSGRPSWYNVPSGRGTPTPTSCSGGSGGGGGTPPPPPPPSTNPSINSISAPGSVTAGGTATVTVNYTATGNQDLRVIFQLDQSPWTVFTEQKRDVTAGTRTATFTLNIPANTPVANDDYQFQIYLATNGGGWAQRLSSRARKDVDCVAGSGGSGGGFAEGVYRLRNVATGLYLDSDGGRVKAGSSSTGADKRWLVVATDGGYYNVDNEFDGRGCLQANSGNRVSNSTVQSPSFSNSREWRLVPVSGNRYRLNNRVSGRGNLYNNSDNTIGYSNSTGTRAQWELIFVSSALEAPDTDNFVNNGSLETDESPVVYPNPLGNGPLTIQAPAGTTDAPLTVAVYSATGQRVAEYQGQEQLQIPAGTLKQGLYLLRISSANSEVTRKLIVR